jgi:S-adenosylmethionine hydrolase
MEYRPVITLTTDFGSKDPFVAIMKGVILNINPSVQMFDITHDISPQNIMEAAFILEMSFRSFPHKTVHVAVVDPGVGSERRPLIVATDYHYFVGPDNGVFSRIYNVRESLEVIHVTSEHYFLPQRSTTFHGRDVFAPIAAWLSKGINITKFGDHISDYTTLPVPVPAMPARNVIEGEVIYIDRFGNLITNIDSKQIDDFCSNNPCENLRVIVKEKEATLKKYYSEAEDKRLYSLLNSFGYLELFVNGGSAASELGVTVGEKIRVII